MRLRSAFIPWLAALVIGASAHAGWLIHELSDHRDQPFAHTPTITAPIDVSVDVHVSEPASRTVRARSGLATNPRAIHCRHASRRPVPATAGSELDFWITRTGRYEYSIDPEMLARVDVAPLVGESGDPAMDRLGQLFGVGQGAGAVELRNIQRETPLWHLGLRTGDRLLSIARPPGADRVQVALARRGRPLVLTYRVV